jgi:hypothetical protein
MQVIIMAHSLIKATIIPSVIKMITDKYNISENEALERFYNSATARNLSDDETGLYGQSALYIFSLFLSECENKKTTLM